MPEKSPVAGIDIGGARKGHHLVVLDGTEVTLSMASRSPEEIANECNRFQAVAVAVDSPCLWALSGTGRTAERMLMAKKVFCFSTPTEERAHSSAFYAWMLQGAEVYRALATTHPLLVAPQYEQGRVSFETFPHAITCALLGAEVASAKRKRVQRRELLESLGIDTRILKSIDAVDAALCAITAQFLLREQVLAMGDADSGFIFTPRGTT